MLFSIWIAPLGASIPDGKSLPHFLQVSMSMAMSNPPCWRRLGTLYAYPVGVSDTPPFDPDEKVSLFPLSGEEVLEELLGGDDDDPEDGTDS